MNRQEMLRQISRAAQEKHSEVSFANEEIYELPKSIGKLTRVRHLDLSGNNLSILPESIGNLLNLITLNLDTNRLRALPLSTSQLVELRRLTVAGNGLMSLPQAIVHLTNLQTLDLEDNQLDELPQAFTQLTNLQTLDLSDNQLAEVPQAFTQLTNLQTLDLRNNQLVSLPVGVGELPELRWLALEGNPMHPALKSAYEAGHWELMAYLRSLAHAEPLYEAKLVLVGEGNVGKTTLLKAMMGDPEQAPSAEETTTHGIEVKVHGLHLSHPDQEEVEIRFNAWDFGGQEVYRPTHQFFFSPRTVYLVVWEPRRGVQQCQVEDWLKMIRLRVGDEARVIVVSTHCETGERLARIDKVVMQRDYGQLIVGFCKVDSLVEDEASGEMVGVAALKAMIAEAAAELGSMGQPFNLHWKKARDELLAQPEARITYEDFAEACAVHGLQPIDARTLAVMMHDLGYIVFFGHDERLAGEVVLKPEWLAKAIGFVLEDSRTAEMDGILPDDRLVEVWRDHNFADEPQYEPDLFPFFLRLMEKFDVSYRFESGDGSLVAQHVPQVRPALPWLPEDAVDPRLNRIAMVCVLEEEPPGIVPWMIVRTHDYAVEEENAAGEVHRLHWRKGMFLDHGKHGTAYLELQGREFQVQTEAVYPVHFMNVLQTTLEKLIEDNWRGLRERYWFGVPCSHIADGKRCNGRFRIDFLRQLLAKGHDTVHCQTCVTEQSVRTLLHGFEERSLRERLDSIEEKVEGLDSRIAEVFLLTMRAIADEAKDGPRLFGLQPLDGDWRKVVSKRYRLRLYCEAEGCQHPVTPQGEGPGVYEFRTTREWVMRVVPYAKFAAGVLKMVLPVVSPVIDTLYGFDSAKKWGVKAPVDLAKAMADDVDAGVALAKRFDRDDELFGAAERSGLLALHSKLRELDPNQENLGLQRVPTYTGEFRWLCSVHYRAAQSKIPEEMVFEKEAGKAEVG